MKKVIRLVSAVGAGASLVWGLARSVARRVRKGDEGDTPSAPEWPPRPSEPMPSEATKSEPVASQEPDPAPEVEEASSTAEALVLKGVAIDNPAAFLAIVNDSDEAALGEAGVKGKALALILEKRPFERAEDVAIPGVGRRTLQAICRVAG